MNTALSLKAISQKSFDGFLALDDVHFTARWGEVHALLGENGAGKSTLMNIACGLYKPEAGEFLLNDNPVHLQGPRDAARHHIGMVHQHFKLVRPFTVAENILLSVPEPELAQTHRDRLTDVQERIRAQAQELGFSIDPDARVDSLSIAEQQRVEILKVLVAGARILILDEPTAVLTDKEAASLLHTIRALARKGAAVILVTHKMADVKAYADQVTIMRQGRTIATVDPATASVTELVRLTIGEAIQSAAVGQRTKAVGDPILTIKDLTSTTSAAPKALNGVSLQVRSGEIYGIAGIGGNGQSELMAAILGLSHATQGTLKLQNVDLRCASIEQRRSLRIAAIPADRYSHALASSLSVSENFAIGNIHSGHYGPFAWLRKRLMQEDTRQAIANFDVQGVRSMTQKTALLSGGNAQKLVLSREFTRQPQIVLAHSPSRGLDVRASAAVHDRLRTARDAGASVLLISEDLDEVLQLSDRIGVMVRGQIVAEFDTPADRHAIGKAMTHHD